MSRRPTFVSVFAPVSIFNAHSLGFEPYLIEALRRTLRWMKASSFFYSHSHAGDQPPFKWRREAISASDAGTTGIISIQVDKFNWIWRCHITCPFQSAPSPGIERRRSPFPVSQGRVSPHKWTSLLILCAFTHFPASFWGSGPSGMCTGFPLRCCPVAIALIYDEGEIVGTDLSVECRGKTTCDGSLVFGGTVSTARSQKVCHTG
jgi:hypothetical protein